MTPTPYQILPPLKFCLSSTLTIMLVLLLLSRSSLPGVEEFLMCLLMGPYSHLSLKGSHATEASSLFSWPGWALRAQLGPGVPSFSPSCCRLSGTPALTSSADLGLGLSFVVWSTFFTVSASHLPLPERPMAEPLASALSGFLHSPLRAHPTEAGGHQAEG